MLGPIISDDKINSNNLLKLSIYSFRKSLVPFTILSLVFTIFFIFKSHSSIGKVSFYTSYESKNSVGLTSSLLDNFSLSDDNIEFSISDYINSDDFLYKIVSSEREINGEKNTLVEHWGSKYNSFFSINPLTVISSINQFFMFSNNSTNLSKKEFIAKKRLAESISLSESRESKLYTVSIRLKENSSLIEEIIEDIYLSIINYSNQVVNAKALEKRLFIENRIFEVKSELEITENEMLIFLENNINATSPSLQLERERIQRDINLHSTVYINLSDQLELAKIDEKDTTSSIFLLDKPKVLIFKAGLSLLDYLIAAFLLSFLSSIFLISYKNRNELFV
jgi:hypothetical protein